MMTDSLNGLWVDATNLTELLGQVFAFEAKSEN